MVPSIVPLDQSDALEISYNPGNVVRSKEQGTVKIFALQVKFVSAVHPLISRLVSLLAEQPRPVSAVHPLTSRLASLLKWQ